MILEVDKQKWEQRENQRPLRLQSIAKQHAIAKFINQALADNVIVPSQAPYWSQVLLTPKPNGQWRFCLDYRKLNKYTKSMGWPIPNIKSIFNRLGSHKPKFFCVFDLTSGYHQTPIHESSQDFTTFQTFMGQFKWKRVPMGLKGAPAFFQMAMANKVFPDLIYKILEIYLDDIILFSQTEDELIERLTIVLQRFEDFNITLNPEKCKVGVKEVEYLGHVINQEGLSFSKEKKEKVVNFPKPQTQKQMKSFLGLASYFRDHIEHHSDIVKALHDMIPGGKNIPHIES